ncbi:MAG: hypothetical protein AAGG46_00175 [Planctomycetota bacterium]
MELLAENIDWLEHHIDTYGSIVAKQPDIWGEARLTKHRDEYERMMFGQLNQFRSTINASITQSDSSFLSQAIALSIAAGGTPGGTAITPAAGVAMAGAAGGAAEASGAQSGNITAPTANAQLVSAPGFASPLRFGFEGQAGADGVAQPGIALEPTIFLDQMSRYLRHLHSLRRINEGDDTSDSPGYSLNLVRIPVSVLPGKLTRRGFGAEIAITAEPVISDDLLPTTFRNLAVNDVVDFMGLPLVRTAEGLNFGTFEVTVAERRKFKRLLKQIDALFAPFSGNITVLDDISIQVLEVESQALIAQILDIDPAREILIQLVTPYVSNAAETQTSASSAAAESKTTAVARKAVQQVTVSSQPLLMLAAKPSNAHSAPNLASKITAIFEQLLAALKEKDAKKVAKLLIQLGIEERGDPAFEDGQLPSQQLRNLANKAIDAMQKIVAAQSVRVVPTGRERRALNPINPSFVKAAVGPDSLMILAEAFLPKYEGRYIRWNGGNTENCPEKRVDLLDARRFLEAQLEAAYELLSRPQHVCLFAQLAAPQSGLATQLRSGRLARELDRPDSPIVEQYRHYFFQQLHTNGSPGAPVSCPVGGAGCYGGSGETVSLRAVFQASKDEEARNSVEALAWALVVESALLNERLNQDVRKVAKAKQALHLETQRDLWFFLPDSVIAPSALGLESLAAEFQQATDVFKRYVAERWPIHVFSVDPREQDQNVADVSQRRRELQFALAVGFANGQIGANTLTQYARELETQVETIGLNRTIVGFGHGKDTFGWRFQPRVQSLPVPGTFGALRETLMGASRDYDLQHRQLEPGKRECVALVLMPSFVPYCDFDIRTNWYKLTNPKNAALTMKDTLHLSRAITSMRNCRAQCVTYEHLYRPMEIRRLLKRIDQLDRELPLQTERAQVPYENTLGGFEMFNTGVTDLSPELIGWYGAPGIRVAENDADCGCYQGCELAKGSSSAEVLEQQAKVVQQQAELAKQQAALVTAQGVTGRLETPLPECEGPGTTIFLVGSKFSVHDTRVVAGGICIPQKQLISRDIMRVTIPRCVHTVELCENGKTYEYVSVYVATPYGVTNHLHVPVDKPKTEEEQAKEAKQEIVNEVKKEVTKQVSALGLTPATMRMAPVTSGDKIVFQAKETAAGLELRPNARGFNVELSFADDPRIRGKGDQIEIWAAVKSESEWLTRMRQLLVVDLKRQDGLSGKLRLALPLMPTLDRGELSLTAEQLESTWPALVTELAGSLPPNSLSTEKAAELTMAFFVKSVGEEHHRAQQLVEDVNIEVTLSQSKSADAEQSAAANAASPEASSEASPTPADDGPILEPLPAPQANEAPCDCDRSSSRTRYRVRPVSSEEPSELKRVPARLAQFQSPTELVPAPLSDDFSERLDRLEQTLREATRRLDEAVLEVREAAPATGAGNVSSAGATAVEVRVVNTTPPETQEHLRWDPAKHPIATQTATRWRERWHNVRDNLPRQ